MPNHAAVTACIGPASLCTRLQLRKHCHRGIKVCQAGHQVMRTPPNSELMIAQRAQQQHTQLVRHCESQIVAVGCGLGSVGSYLW